MTPKQQRFVEEYLVDLNASAAAVRAGYAKSGAGVEGARLLKNANVAAEIAKGMETRSERTEITQDMVVRELAKIGFSDVRRLFDGNGRMKHVTMLDDDAVACIASIEVALDKKRSGDGEEYDADATLKVRLWDKRAALVDLGKHLGMFKERVELTGKDGGAIQMEQKVNEDALAFRSRLLSGVVAAAANGRAGETVQ